MTSSPAILHYRQMFDSRSPEQMRVLAHIKRFMERLTGDDTFRAALAENADDPRDLARRFGIDVDPSALLPLWHARYRPHRRTPECAPWPLAVAWDEYMTQMLRHRDLLREEGDMAGVHPRFQAWRNRQMQRCAGELGDSAAAITHPIISFELSDGCSVGCWFCGIAADRFKGYYSYSDEHARLWRRLVEVTRELFGPASRSGFCYWATDPSDNPDYDKFLVDYYEITDALPQTTTAAPLKDVALTRRILALFDKYRTVTNRFSVLTLRQLNQIHATFTPEELMGVELVMQQRESLNVKADAGGARLRKARLHADGKDDTVSPIKDYPTIACVSGFLVNLMRGSIRLVTPVPASKRWPLGYRVLGERLFQTAEAFRSGLEELIDAHMRPELAPHQPVRFRRDLAYEAGGRTFRLTSRGLKHTIRDTIGPTSIGALIAQGDRTAAELVSSHPTDMLAVADFLDRLFEAGLLEEDFDDSFAGAQNEGLILRARTLGRKFAATDAAHADPA